MGVINKQENQIRKKECLIVLITALLVVLIHGLHLFSLSAPYVLDDEFGYWSIAAYFAGLDFSSAVSTAFYYSYGYSLALSLFMRLSRDPVVLYRMAIAFNAMLAGGSFLILYGIGRKLFVRQKKEVLLTAVFCIALYPNALAQSSVAWSETLLLFVCSAVCYVFATLNEKKGVFSYTLLGALIVYAYMIHQRTLGMLIASLCVLLYKKVKGETSWSQLTAFVVTVALLLFLHKIIKADIKANVWLGRLTLQNNDFAGQVGKIAAIFTVDGLLKTLRAFAGQVFYIGAASLFTAFFGIWFLLESSFMAVLEGVRHKKKMPFLAVDSFSLFLILAFLASVAISTIFMNEPNRLDQVVYGRYTDMLMGPVMLIGIAAWKGSKKEGAILLMASAVLLVGCALLARPMLDSLGAGKFNGICSVGLWRFYYDGRFHIYRACLFFAFVGGLFYLLYFLGFRKKFLQNAAFLVMGGLFLFTGESFVNNRIVPSSRENIKNKELVDYMDTMNSSLPVYFAMGEDFYTNSYRDIMQFLMPEKALQCVTYEELLQNGDEKFVVIHNANRHIFKLLEKYTVVDMGRYGSVLVTNGSETLKNIEKWKGEVFSHENRLMVPLDTLSSQNNTNLNGDFLVSSGEKGLLTFGPYMTLDRGSYRAYASLELLSHQGEAVGYMELTAGGRRLGKASLDSSEFDSEGRALIEVPFGLSRAADRIEIRIFTEKGTVLKVEEVSLSRENYRYINEIDLSKMSAQTASFDGNSLVSDGRYGFAAFGPYLYLEADNYEAEIKIRIQNMDTAPEKLLTADISAGKGDVIASRVLLKQDIIGETLTVTLPFALKKDAEDLEIRVLEEEGVQIMIDSIKLQNVDMDL